jgi:hypothetical protein
MAFATTAKVGAKTKLEYEDFTTPATWHLLATVKDLPDVGDNVEPLNATPLHSVDHVYIDGDKNEPDDMEITMQDIPGNTEHEAFITRAKGFLTATLKITYNNGRVAEFDVQLLGYKVNPPTRGDVITISVTAKRTGGITWSEAA